MVENAEGPVAIMQSRPAIDPPSDRPSGGDIAARVECDLRRIREVWRPSRRDLCAGEQSIKVGDMTMLLFRRFCVPVLQPFLQLTVGSDLVWRQPCSSAAELFSEFNVGVEDF